MTVKELIDRLQSMDPKTRVFEDSGSELRELLPEDISSAPTAEGQPIDMGEYSEEEFAELEKTPIVIFGAWS